MKLYIQKFIKKYHIALYILKIVLVMSAMTYYLSHVTVTAKF